MRRGRNHRGLHPYLIKTSVSGDLFLQFWPLPSIVGPPPQCICSRACTCIPTSPQELHGAFFFLKTLLSGIFLSSTASFTASSLKDSSCSTQIASEDSRVCPIPRKSLQITVGRGHHFTFFGKVTFHFYRRWVSSLVFFQTRLHVALEFLSSKN